MKAQKLGLVLGMNMAVAACMMMQGCKANKAKTDLPPESTTVVAAAPADNGAVATTPSLAPTATTPTTVATTPADGTPSGVVIEPGTPDQPTATAPTTTPQPQPSNVRTVPALPPVGKPAPAKPAARPAVTSTPAGTKPTAAATAPAATSAAGGLVYTVKPGDQLFAVSRRYNVRMDAIKKANPGLNPDRIRVGQKITIPGVAAPAATAVATVPAAGTATTAPTTMLASAPAPTAANTVAPVKTKPAFKAYVGATKEYKVQPGDSLGKIAIENGISIRALKELNKLTGDNVRAGRTLLVPAEKVAAEKPAATTVKKPAPTADAKKPAATKATEDKKSAPSTVKQDGATKTEAPAVKVEEKKDAAAEVKVEEKKDAAAPATPAAAPAAAPAEQPKAEPPAAEPAAAAPAPAPAAGGTYTVKEGDDLVSVSITCGISPSQLMDLNGLKPGDSIKAGQVLKLPAGAKPSEE